MNSVPTLMTTGSTEAPKLKLSALFKYFLIADYSQTFYYTGNVASLKYIISKFDNHNVSKLKDDIIEALTTMYERYFDNIRVDLNIREDGAKLHLEFYISTIVNDKIIKITDNVEINDLKIIFEGSYQDEILMKNTQE